MGIVKKLKNKYISHKKKWDKNTIVEEKELVKNYGIKSKKEIRKYELMLSKFKRIAKSLNTNEEMKNSISSKNFISKLHKFGFLKEELKILDDVLGLRVEDLFERTLTSCVYRKKLANSVNQARQFITHKHILIGEKIVNSPNYLVTLKEEELISLKNPEMILEKEKEEVVEEVKEEETKEEVKEE